MGCPQCHSDEISPSGVCLICGYQAESEREADSAPAVSGIIEMDYSEGSPQASEGSEVPKWRQELSTRLHQIQQKREAQSATRQEVKDSSAGTAQPKAEALSALQARLQKIPVRKPQPPFVPPPRQKALEPVEPQPPAKMADPGEIRTLIDNAVSRQAAQVSAPSGLVEHTEYMPEQAEDDEGKLILLSRTLAGLVDLIVIVLCSGGFIVAADHFYGIVALDRISLIHFSVLFLLNYFLYSLFFLFASNQTIGMMITDLRVVDADEKRPSVGQIIRRCLTYLISLFGLGFGLISGLFDRDSRCFHDRHSGTHVVRV